MKRVRVGRVMGVRVSVRAVSVSVVRCMRLRGKHDLNTEVNEMYL